MNNEYTVGEKIKELRKDLGLSQEELALKCGLNRNSIYKYEKGTTLPKTQQIIKIADALEVDPAVLLSTRTWVDSFTGQDANLSLLNKKQQHQLMDIIDQSKTKDSVFFRAEKLIALYGYTIKGDDSNGYIWIEGNGIKFEISEEDIKNLEKSISFALKLKLEELMDKNIRDK